MPALSIENHRSFDQAVRFFRSVVNIFTVPQSMNIPPRALVRRLRRVTVV